MTARSFCLLALFLTAGCGFHPLYDVHSQQVQELASVYVDIIPNRTGQLLREAIQTRLEGASTGIAKRFTLGVAYSESAQGVAVQTDNSSTRTRDIGTVIWSLRRAGSTVQLAGGTVRSLDGYNIIDEQFFYATLSEENAQRRLANVLADQILEGLAVYFGSHPVRG